MRGRRGDRGQAYALEAIVTSLILLSGLVFALQATAVTPLSASTSSQHIENQQAATAEGVLATAADDGSLRVAVLNWDDGDGEFHGSDADRSYYTNTAPENGFGDLLSRALGIASPGDGADHVFAHVGGADGRSQADARHMNSLCWSGTIGYYLRTLLVDNRWTNRESIWEGYDGDDGGTARSFPTDAATELGETLKEIDAWRRHFVRYVRAGGPFPPMRIGSIPYGILPAAPLPDEESAAGRIP